MYRSNQSGSTIAAPNPSSAVPSRPLVCAPSTSCTPGGASTCAVIQLEDAMSSSACQEANCCA